jgi:hypothetical protein
MKETDISPARYGKNCLLAAFSILWLLLAGGGLWFVSAYENSPGIVANPSVQFPAGSKIPRIIGRPTLVMLAHPHCPCTRASVGELARLMAQSQGLVNGYVLFLKPSDFVDNWEKTDLWRSAASIPGVTVMQDNDGNEAKFFNAATSGQTFLYDATGQLLFNGGITSARGHSGDNLGRDAIVSLLSEGEAEQTETAVYGCPLFNRNSECRMEESYHETHNH